MWKALCLLLLTGCIANNTLGSAAIAQDNVYGISRLSIGMTESEVLQIMNYPYKKKRIEHGEDSYDIWFYITRGVALDQTRMLYQNLTPLTFENGVLLGWGNDFYKHVVRSVSEAKNMVELRDKNEERRLEKAIENLNNQLSPSSNTSASQPPEPAQKGKKTPQKPDKNHKKDDKNQKKGSDKLDDEDREMIREENDQNFDFW